MLPAFHRTYFFSQYSLGFGYTCYTCKICTVEVECVGGKLKRILAKLQTVCAWWMLLGCALNKPVTGLLLPVECRFDHVTMASWAACGNSGLVRWIASFISHCVSAVYFPACRSPVFIKPYYTVLNMFYAFTGYAVADALYFCFFSPVVPMSVLVYVPCHRYFFRFARTLNGFRWNLREVVITTNRLNCYILGEIGTGTREHDTTENWNRCQAMLQRCQTGADV